MSTKHEKRLSKRVRELEDALDGCYRLARNACEHITDDLQPEFRLLAEKGVISWVWREQPYDEAQAAWRLATWWHGAGTDEVLEKARQLLERAEAQ